MEEDPELRALYIVHKDSVIERLNQGTAPRRILSELTESGLDPKHVQLVLERIAADLPDVQRAAVLKKLRRARNINRIALAVGLSLVGLWLLGMVVVGFKAWRETGADPILGWFLLLKTLVAAAVWFIVWKVWPK